MTWVQTLLANKGYNPDQPRVPAGQSGGGRWSASGGGGFLSGLSHPNADDRIYKRIAAYDLGKPTTEQERAFVDHINQSIHSDLQELWPPDTKPPFLAIAPDRWTAWHQGRWIVLPDDSLDGPTAEHEFLHDLVQQAFGVDDAPASKINQYRPDPPFFHAARAERERCEDLTMMLQGYDPDRKKWSSNIKAWKDLRGDGKTLTDVEVEMKVKQAGDFLDQVRHPPRRRP